MKGRLVSVFVAFTLLATAYCLDGHPLLPEVQQHLDLARRCASRGRIDEALAHAAVVLPLRTLRVQIDCSNVTPSGQSLYRNAVSGAFRMWQEALGQQVFELTEVGSADITVHFQPDVSDKGTEVCGHSHWTRGVLNPETEPTVVFSADVQLRMVQPNDQPLTLDQLRACMAHELGHILGLDDSSASGDVMSRMDFSHPATLIRPEEVATLVRARDEAIHIRQIFADRARHFKQ